MDRSLGKLSILVVLIPLLIFPSILSIQSEQLTEYSYNDHKKDQEFKQFQNSLPSLSLTPHNPIFIDSDDDFINYNFIGNGSKVNPYIIENYLINSTIKNYGIIIKFTSKFFVIRNCYIGKCYKACILIENVEEGTAKIINNTCSGFFMLDSFYSQSHGIFIKNSPNSAIIDNYCRSNMKYGIYILSSPNCTISNCLTYSNYYAGICVRESQYCKIINNIGKEDIRIINSSYCLIKNNTCIERYCGIYLENSDFCEISDNRIEGCYDFGICLKKTIFCEIRNNRCNKSGFGIKLIDTVNITVDNNYLSYNRDGIAIQNSINSTITNNRFYRDGIRFEESGKIVFETIMIKNNTIEIKEEGVWKNKEIALFMNLKDYVFPETDYGQIILFNCSEVKFNEIHYQNYGIYELELYQCEAVSFTGNSVDGTILLDNVTDSIINANIISKLIMKNSISNRIEDNQLFGVELYKSSHIDVLNNTNSLDSKGFKVYTWLYISNCHQLNIIDNFCQKVYCAIFAKHSSFLEISRNNLTENYGSERFDMEIMDFKWFISGGSIELLNSSKSIVVQNNLTEGSDGVRLLLSCDNLVANNSIEKYSYGIGLYHTKNNNIVYNIIKTNFVGIDIENSNSINIIDNKIEGNMLGIVVDKSKNSNITKNLIKGNEYGIELIEECKENKITYNIVKENIIGIYVGYKTKDNILHHNYFFNNTQQAIDYSGKNTWYEISTEEGNYWSDHNKKKPYEIAGDGEAIDPYPLNENLERIKRAQFLNIYYVILSLISLIVVKKRKKRRK